MTQKDTRYARLGEQITRLVKRLSEEKSWTKTRTMAYLGESVGYGTDMIHRWRQGKACPSSHVVETLAQIGKKDAGFPREWGEKFLKAAQYHDTENLLCTLWGSKSTRIIPCNLRARERTYLIGRQAEITRLLELLSPDRAASHVTVDGIGGVGKTALVLEVAYQCWKASTDEDSFGPLHAPRFDAIIFVSAKQQELTSADGFLTINEARRTLRDIFREIASTLNVEISRTTPEDQASLIHKVLARQRTLLIVDNLETMADKQEVMSFLYELPSSVKVMITTRERVSFFPPIHLEQLAREEALRLIEEEAREKDVSIDREQALTLYQHIGGIPIALIYAIGQISCGFSLETVLDKIPRASSDIALFCFEGSIGPLRGRKAYNLLMAIALFPKKPLYTSIVYVAGLMDDPKIVVEEGLALLQKLSLVRQHHNRYQVLPLTREYLLSELAAHRQFEQEIRQRWVDWYLDFTKEYGGKDWDEWSIQYERINEEWENLLAIFYWCAAQEKYHTLQLLWQEKDRYLVKFSHIYGYWADRITWLDWLIKAGEGRSDWSNMVRAMVDKASTLTLIGLLEEAENLLTRAWDNRKSASDWVQIIIAAKLANLSIYQEHYPQALLWLEEAERLLDEAKFDEPEQTRRRIDLQIYRGIVSYKQRDYVQAEQYYLSVLHHSQKIGWQRIVILAKIYLANITVALGRLDEAETLLETNLPMLDHIKDERIASLYRQSLALLRKEQGKAPEAIRWAQEALDGFERLDMKNEIHEIHTLLQLLQRIHIPQ